MGDLAVVTGAAGALGRAVVEALTARGDDVLAVTRDGRPEGLTANDGSVQMEAADLGVPEQVEALWRRLDDRGGRLRWVINTAGGYRPGSVADTDLDAYRFLHDLNLGTAWWSCRSAAPRLPAGGGIVNLASRSALTGGAGSAAYSVAKAGVVRLTGVLAAELIERGVRVNAVLPSVMDTPANRASMSAEAMRGAAAPEDVAAVVAFLCSDAARAVTGAAIPAYGAVT